MLKIDKKGNILRPDGSILGKPVNKKGTIKRSHTITGRLDPNTGEVYNINEEVIGKVLLETIELFGAATEASASIKPIKPTKSKKGDSKTSKRASAPKIELQVNLPKKEEKKNEYRPGLDSALIVSGQFSKLYYKKPVPSTEDKALNELNKKHGWNYDDWDVLSANENLTDAELSKYETYISWFHFLASHPDREFDEKHRKMFKPHLAVRVLGLVPYNGYMKGEDYKVSSIKEDRARAEHIKELKSKRETRKRLKDESSNS